MTSEDALPERVEEREDGAAPRRPDRIETLVAARLILDPDDVFQIWRSAMTVPAALMAECFQFSCHRMLAQAAFLEGVGAQDFAAEALDVLKADAEDASPASVRRNDLAA